MSKKFGSAGAPSPLCKGAWLIHWKHAIPTPTWIAMPSLITVGQTVRAHMQISHKCWSPRWSPDACLSCCGIVSKRMLRICCTASRYFHCVVGDIILVSGAERVKKWNGMRAGTDRGRPRKRGWCRQVSSPTEEDSGKNCTFCAQLGDF